MNAKFIKINGGTPIPVVESSQLQDDFQAISASVFLDRSGRNILWPVLDYQTRDAFEGHAPLLETVFAYQESDAAALVGRVVSKTYANGADVMAVVLEGHQTSLSVTDGDGNALEYLDDIQFGEHDGCFLYVTIAESSRYDFNVPVAIHEKSYMPHLRLHDDVLTMKSFSAFKTGRLMDGSKDARSGVTMAGALSVATVSNW